MLPLAGPSPTNSKRLTKVDSNSSWTNSRLSSSTRSLWSEVTAGRPRHNLHSMRRTVTLVDEQPPLVRRVERKGVDQWRG